MGEVFLGDSAVAIRCPKGKQGNADNEMNS